MVIILIVVIHLEKRKMSLRFHAVVYKTHINNSNCVKTFLYTKLCILYITILYIFKHTYLGRYIIINLYLYCFKKIYFVFNLSLAYTKCWREFIFHNLMCYECVCRAKTLYIIIMYVESPDFWLYGRSSVSSLIVGLIIVIIIIIINTIIIIIIITIVLFKIIVYINYNIIIFG